MAGQFIWYELLTGDIAGATAFYKAVVGWNIVAHGAPEAGGMDYRMIGRDDGGFAGGCMEITPDMAADGARPVWLGYIHVADVDAEIAAVQADGGSVCFPATTIEGVGRIAMVLDPQGAPYYVMAPQPPAGRPDAVSDVFSVDRAQHVRWNELIVPDADAALAFYTTHYGWVQDGAFDMGALGPYRFLFAEGVRIGALMKQADFMPRVGWNFYIGVADIDAAHAAVTQNGGRTLGDPNPIPGGEFTVHAIDPQGAFFGLVGPRPG